MMDVMRKDDFLEKWRGRIPAEAIEDFEKVMEYVLESEAYDRLEQSER